MIRNSVRELRKSVTKKLDSTIYDDISNSFGFSSMKLDSTINVDVSNNCRAAVDEGNLMEKMMKLMIQIS